MHGAIAHAALALTSSLGWVNKDHSNLTPSLSIIVLLQYYFSEFHRNNINESSYDTVSTHRINKNDAFHLFE